MWFENSYRRHLLDMHITDWGDGVFLSQFSPEEYYENLKRANVKSTMIYLQSHVGYCYFPTKVGVMHSAFKEHPDTMKRLIELCRSGGIDVTVYYSINYNSLEHDRHPEWAAVAYPDAAESHQMFRGGRYGICCPNNPEYVQFVLEQVTEMLTYAEVDGIFFDMPFWPYPCYCLHCQEKYRKQFGVNMPASRQDCGWKAFLYNREKWNDEYLARLTEHVKKQKPNISVQYNYAYAALNALDHFASEVVNKYQDYASGDLYDGFLTQSFACKFYSAVTRNKPFEYMTGRCDPSLSSHTVTKSRDKLRLACLLTMAHHGANFVIDAIDPIGTMDTRFYEFLGQIYKEIETYEPWLNTGDMVGDIGLFYIMEGRDEDTAYSYGHYKATLTTAKTLIQNHVPYRIISQATVGTFEQYKAIIIANPNGLHSDTIEKLKVYVNRGGILYFSGGDQGELLSELLDTEPLGYTQCSNTYIAAKKGYETVLENFNEKYPLAFQWALPIIKPVADAEVLATIVLPYIHPTDKEAFVSIHSNPPGTYTQHPAVIVKTFGKGRVIWSAAAIEAKQILCYQQILFNLLSYVGVKEYSIKTNASRNTEIILFEAEDQMLISAVYLTEEEETEVQKPFEITVKGREPKQVVLLGDGTEMAFRYENGYITFTTRELNVFDMYQIIL